jgi:hypothetical protein
MAGRDPIKQKEAKRRYYEANKDVVKAKAKAHTRDVRNRIRGWIYAYLLNHPCLDCGETDPIILEFDHFRDKEFNIGEATSLGISLKRVKLEIEKCDVRCANCHRKKTYRDAGHKHRG